MGFFRPTWVKILIVVILVLVGSIVAYLLGTRQNQPHPFSQLTPSLQTPTGTRFSPTIVQPSPTPFPTRPAQATTTDKWETYVDGENGFELKYPPTWSQLLLGNHTVAITPNIPQPFKASETFYSLPGASIYVATDNYKRLTATDYVHQNVLPQNSYTRHGKITATISNGGVIVTGMINPVSGEEEEPTAYIAHDQKVIEIGFDATGIANGEQLFQQMLSTLTVWTPQKPPH